MLLLQPFWISLERFLGYCTPSRCNTFFCSCFIFFWKTLPEVPHKSLNSLKLEVGVPLSVSDKIPVPLHHRCLQKPVVWHCRLTQQKERTDEEQVLHKHQNLLRTFQGKDKYQITIEITPDFLNNPSELGLFVQSCDTRYSLLSYSITFLAEEPDVNL